MQVAGEILRSAQDDSGIVCREIFYPAALRVDRHAHESPFFGLAIDGSFSEAVGQRQFEYGARGVVYHGAGEEHSVSIGCANVRAFVLELDGSDIERRYGVSLPSSMLHDDGGPFAALLTNMYREFRHPDSSSWLAIQGLVLQLLVASTRTKIECGRPRWLDRVDDLLRTRFRGRITLEEIATEVGVSAARISTAFRGTYRRSLAEEQRRLRVEWACRRLTEDEVSLADVALESGFADQPHFSRTFKAIMSMTPAQYRAMVRGEGGRQLMPPPSECGDGIPRCDRDDTSLRVISCACT